MVHSRNDQIAALATPWGSSAIAVIRTSGPDCIGALGALTDRRDTVTAAPGGALRRARIVDPSTGEVLDDVVLGIYREPRSYTGEEIVEIFCHGSVPGIREILSLLYRSGFRAAEPGEFTLRAFLAGKVDLTRAEAVQEIVRSRTAAGHEMALRRLGGSVEAAINRCKAALVQLMAMVAVQLDYPEEETGEIPLPEGEIRRVRSELADLAATYRTGRLYQEGIRIALAGRTNAGKSSLFNALLREDRSIVSETPGTTRDYIESTLDLEGIPATLFDTAGLRDTAEEIEGEGIRRTTRVMEAADVILYLVDGVEGLTPEDERILATFRGSRESTGATHVDSRPDAKPAANPAEGDSAPSRLLLVWNKVDSPACRPAPPEYIPVSATAMHGLEALARTVLERVRPGSSHRETAVVIDSRRQRDLLDRAVDSLRHVENGVQQGIPVDAISLDLQEAIHALGEITGEVSSADILDALFQGFCVGK